MHNAYPKRFHKVLCFQLVYLQMHYLSVNQYHKQCTWYDYRAHLEDNNHQVQILQNRIC